MQKKIEELLSADQIVGGLIQSQKTTENSKFIYAWKKFYRLNMKDPISEYQDKVQDIRIKYAQEDKGGSVVNDPTNPRGYKYSKESLQSVIKEEKDATKELNEREIEVKPYICPVESLPELTDEEKEQLKGLIIE
jgi:hypothetical protein